MKKKADEATNPETLPRSIYVPTKDRYGEIREIVNAVFSDRFMIFLSALLIPIIIVPFVFNLDATVLSFLNLCDMTIVILFVAEYVTKLYFAQNRWSHFKSPWHLLDLIIVILPFVELLPFLSLPLIGSPSLLLRFLRVPRMLAVGGRAIVGRRNDNGIPVYASEKQQPTVIRQVDSNLKVSTETLTWNQLKDHIKNVEQQEWLDIQYITDRGFLDLSRILEIAEPHFKSRLIDEIYPHIDYIQKSSFIFLQLGEIKYPEHVDNFLTISRSGIIVICNGKKIITVSRHNVDLFEDVLNSVNKTRKENEFVVPVLYGILERVLEDYKMVLNEIEIEVLKIGGTPRSKLPKDFLERIYPLEKEVSRLVSNLVHFKDMLSVVISKKVPLNGFDQVWEEAFQVLQDNAEYLDEISHGIIDNLHSIIDLYINQTSFETNKILKILAVITALSVIPTAVSGLLGSNLLDAPYGAYLWQLSFIVTVAMVFSAYVFVKLGWLKT